VKKETQPKIEKLKTKPDERKKNGGVRPGSGRKKGYLTQKTREIAAKAIDKGITPLEVMLEAMMTAYNEGGAKEAFEYAKDCALYLHPRLAATTINGGIDIGLKEIKITHVYANTQKMTQQDRPHGEITIRHEAKHG
jgi:hypothetical protein